MPDPYTVLDALELVEANLDALLMAPPTEHMAWSRDGTEFDHVVFDGPQLALQLVDLHRRARVLAGVARGRDRMPVPCPRCESAELGRWHGEDTVNCLACGSIWTESDYRRLTLVLADDLAAAHKRPKRERHLAAAYRDDTEATKARRL